MISKEHKKHSDLTKPALGNFGRNEYAVLGTTCINVKMLADEVIKVLALKYKCAYADAEHSSDDTLLKTQDAFIEYTDKISNKEFRYKKQAGPFQYRALFNEADLILVNGNHYKANKQIVVIDKTKEVSLLKRKAQLNNVQLILLHENADGIFDFVKEAVPNWQALPVLSLHYAEDIISFFEKQLLSNTAVLNGLVLAGGKSVRMGFDKTAIEWYGKPQRCYMTDMLENLCEDVFISYSNDKPKENNYKYLQDTFTGLGPYGAILSAFREQPNRAWLVTASDLPLLDQNSLQYLIAHRNKAAVATTFESPHDGLPEPLITIWEPTAYPILLSFLGQGYSCPRKVLINNDVTIIKAPHPENLVNINTPEEMELAVQKLQYKNIVA